jgi:hypothetical protein
MTWLMSIRSLNINAHVVSSVNNIVVGQPLYIQNQKQRKTGWNDHQTVLELWQKRVSV